jgi:hypothetical protein
MKIVEEEKKKLRKKVRSLWKEKEWIRDEMEKKKKKMKD